MSDWKYTFFSFFADSKFFSGLFFYFVINKIPPSLFLIFFLVLNGVYGGVRSWSAAVDLVTFYSWHVFLDYGLKRRVHCVGLHRCHDPNLRLTKSPSEHAPAGKICACAGKVYACANKMESVFWSVAIMDILKRGIGHMIVPDSICLHCNDVIHNNSLVWQEIFVLNKTM